MAQDSKTPTGAAIIRGHLKNLPNRPGVYRMLDGEGKALYVGKAKSLKNRVGSYVTGRLNSRLTAMVNKTARMEFAVTGSEAEALLLEANLIKSLMPRYNILLRDDKSFPYIKLTKHAFPRLEKYRGTPKKDGEYFGPFASAGAVNATLAQLQRAFRLRNCSDHVLEHRSRPCLQYQIKRCSAPCVRYVDEAQYAGLVSEARGFLTGGSRDIQSRLAEQMQAASDALDFETAADLRDRIRALTRVQQTQGLQLPDVAEADVMAIYREGPHACVQLFSFRGGQPFGSQAYFPSASDEDSDADILTAFIGQYYESRPAPRLLLTSLKLPEAELLAEALSITAPRKVAIDSPSRGPKCEALKHAGENARQALQRRLAERTGQAALLKGVAGVFGMENPPRRIEVYDNSHISGTHAVGGMVCAGPEGFLKSNYRRYNIPKDELPPGDDYAMMRHVLTRRFQRLVKEDPDHETDAWPDLVLIDGGQGQLNTVCQVFADLGVRDVTLVGIAKGVDRDAGREKFFLPGKPYFQLPENHAVLHYLQRLRDEAHRWAISGHRGKRSRAITASPLDEVAGIGPTRKKALLRHFGSARAVSSASIDDLRQVNGLSDSMAQQIYEHFHR